MSVYDNVAFGPRTHGVKDKARLDGIVENALRKAAIWDELKDRLKKAPWAFRAASSSACASRAPWPSSPRCYLMDEATKRPRPLSTGRIEELAVELKKDYTVVMVTHNMQQAGAHFRYVRILPAGRPGRIRRHAGACSAVLRTSAPKTTLHGRFG